MTRRSLLLLLLIGLLLASCAPSASGQPTPDTNGTIQAAAQTMVAALAQTQTALAPTATNTALPTVTSAPSATALALLMSPTVFVQQPVFIAASATPTGPTPTPLASSLGVGCKNLRLINNWTDPDSPLNPGQNFTQFWQVENNGTCDWMYLFTFEYASGDKLGETTSVKLGNRFPPDKWTTLSVSMHAPNKSGTYRASWRMTDGGTQFGAILPVSITVGGPTNTPKPDTAATNAAAQQNAVNTAVAATLTKAAENANATASSVAATASSVAATETKEALCLTSPEPPPDPVCP